MKYEPGRARRESVEVEVDIEPTQGVRLVLALVPLILPPWDGCAECSCSVTVGRCGALITPRSGSSMTPPQSVTRLDKTAP